MLNKLSQTLILSLVLSVSAVQADTPALETPASTDLKTQTAHSESIRSVPPAQPPTPLTKSAAVSSSTTPIEKPDGWQVFVSPARDFRILLPANVKRTANDKLGRSAMMYFQRDANGVDYLIADGLFISPARKTEDHEAFYQEAVSTIEKQLNQKTATLEKEVSGVNGKGWHGKQVQFKKGNTVLATVRIAYSTADDVAYKMLASSGQDNANIRTFFDSFEVDPAMASRAHVDSTPPPSTSDAPKNSKASASVKNFVDIIWTISVALLAICVFGLITSGLRNRKNKGSGGKGQD